MEGVIRRGLSRSDSVKPVSCVIARDAAVTGVRGRGQRTPLNSEAMAPTRCFRAACSSGIADFEAGSASADSELVRSNRRRRLEWRLRICFPFFEKGNHRPTQSQILF